MKETNTKKIGIVGLGYVGLVSAVGFTLKGYEVKCVDINNEVVQSIKNGKSNFYEPNINDNLKKAIEVDKDYLEAQMVLGLVYEIDEKYIDLGIRILPTHINGLFHGCQTADA